ncbi:hypothetical protein JW721_04410 [Candidatus Micrarchaeota archaeon]|nr:hypothetical protein [Candidatus Micrarchaeota archaeon]
MKTATIAFCIMALLFLCGCVTLPDASKCESLNEQEILSGAGWGEVVVTDESYVLKSRIGCWHSVALADAAREDPGSAAAHCTKILDLQLDYPDYEDLLNSEFNTCVDAVARRMRDPGLCANMDEEESAFEYNRCVAHATPPQSMCTGAFILFAAAATLMVRAGKN